MKRNRSELKGYFERGNNPTESNFADLIDSVLNQEEDNIFSESGKVGIGTSQQSADLDVKGTAKAERFEGDGSALTVDGATLAMIKKTLAEMVPIGTIMAYGGDVTDKQTMEQLKSQGWLFCDGGSLNRVEYKELYETLGGAFGAPDVNSFNLPDLCGRFVRGVDHGRGNDPDAGSRSPSAPGGNEKDKVGSMQEDAIRNITGSITGVKGASSQAWNWGFHPETNGAFTVEKNLDSYNKYAGTYKPTSGVGNVAKFDASKSAGVKTAAENRPKNIYVNWIIKAKHSL